MADRFAYIRAFFFPQRCACCGTVIEPRERLCASCAAALPRMEPPCCPRCGRTKALCTCHGHRRQFDRCCASFCYEGVIRRAVLRMKDGERRYIAEMLGEELMQTVACAYAGVTFDVVTFVPADRRRSRDRGFHAGEVLARELAKHMGLPCEPLLTKIISTPAQKELKPVERSGNVLGAFDLLPDAQVNDRRVLLVDDVITTGSTLNECAKMLKIGGASFVLTAVAAASVPEKGEK